MKNLLSENMLRFGTKNLSDSDQRKLVFESIMQTIDEYGLHGAVRRNLSEQVPVKADKNFYGYAQKVYNEIDKGLGGKMFGMADDEDKVLAAVKSIDTIAGKENGAQVYANLLQLVKKSPVLKAKYGRNYNLVATFISYNGIAVSTGKAAGRSTPTRTNPIFGKRGGPQANDPYIDKMKAILGKYNSTESDDYSWYEPVSIWDGPGQEGR